MLCRKWGRRTSSRPLFVFLKSFFLGKSKWSAAWFHYISIFTISLKLAYNRNKSFKTLHYWSRDMLNFSFLDKGLGMIFLHHILCKQKYSSCYILLTDQILLPGCLYFLRYWEIYVLQLLFIQVVTSRILKLTLYHFPNTSNHFRKLSL